MIYAVGDAGTSLLVQNIQSHIIDECTILCRNTSKKLAEGIKTLDIRLPHRNIPALIDSCIISGYKSFWDRFSIDLSDRITGFGFYSAQSTLPRPDERIFGYNVDYRLIREFCRTENLSSAAEKLIDKTLDLTLLNRLALKPVEDALLCIKPGKQLLNSIGMGASSHKARHMRQLHDMLDGINRNICLRIQNLMLKHFTNLIYRTREITEDDCIRLIG